MRLDMNLPVAALALLIAAAAQDLMPVHAWLPVKPVFLTGVALYFMMTRPLLIAVTVLLWAGAFTDALGGLPRFGTPVFLLAILGGVRALQRTLLNATLLNATLWQGALLCGIVSLAQVAWTLLWVRTGEPFLGWRTLELLMASVPAGLIAGWTGFAFCRLLDRISGSVVETKDADGLRWTDPDR